MPWCSSPQPVERAKPLFGSIAVVRALGDDRAVSAAFEEMQAIQALMSFQSAASELSRVNREAVARPVELHPHTFAVFEAALGFARQSDGVFDPAVGALAVAAGDLAAPEGAPNADPEASWRDVELDRAQRTVRFHRPLWADLGGVAKGYAVDLACEALVRHGVEEGMVDAGGDLRAIGEAAVLVRLDPGPAAAGPAPVVELEAMALASSGRLEPVDQRRACAAAHFDGRSRSRLAGAFASVASPSCLAADVLSKMVLAKGEGAEPLLRRHGAVAWRYTLDAGWRMLGDAGCA